MTPPRRENLHKQEPLLLFFEHPQTGATVEHSIAAPVGPPGPYRLDRIRYINPTGLTEDATNFFAIELLVDGEVAASWSTETGEEGTLPAGEWVEFTLTEDVVDLVGQSGDEITLALAEDGNATLPAGRIQVEGRFL
jgi:hypothetical protein